MPVLIQICVVVVTLAIVALATATILALIRLGAAMAQVTSAAQASVGQVERVVLETHELLAAVREVILPAQRIAHRFERLGERTADLSASLLDEIEQPIRTAVAVARGARTGSTRLLDLLVRRFAQRRSSNDGNDPAPL